MLSLYLMQFEAHSDCRSHHLLEEVEISENPLILSGDAEVAFKQGVETVQKWFKTLKRKGGIWGGGIKETQR